MPKTFPIQRAVMTQEMYQILRQVLVEVERVRFQQAEDQGEEPDSVNTEDLKKAAYYIRVLRDRRLKTESKRARKAKS